MMQRFGKALLLAFIVWLAVFNFGCGSGGGNGGGRTGGTGSADFDCDGGCANLNLSVSDVSRILQQGIAASELLGVSATFAVVDRVGNVLAVYQMASASATTTINGQIGAVGGLEGLTVPSSLAAISKAGTGAYLSSQGNSFSTRTASQIVQENFNPGERNQPGGPLFGVQFSQFLCSDVTVRNSDVADGRPSPGRFSYGGSVGPRPLPLGLSADPGGIPLYMQGDMVGGIGVELDGAYRLDRLITDTDDDIEERIAMMASIGYEAPSERVAPNVNVGKSLRYVDLDYSDLDALPEVLPELDSSRLLAIAEFTNGTIRAGSVFGDVSSGVAKTVRAGVPSAILVNPDGSARYPTRAGTSRSDGLELTAGEVDALLDSVLKTADRTRAAIRRPLDTPARVSIWVVDHVGVPLGFVRSQDAPVFGIDVALQKGRGAILASSADAADVLIASGFGGYVDAVRSLLGPTALTGSHAFADRAIGNLSRPYFPDGINGSSNGPLSHPFPGTVAGGPSWSPFNTGLQLDLVFGGLAQSLGLVASSTLPSSCTPSALGKRVANGIQIFPGSVPLYRNGVLIGGVGISGDGVDQDDLIAFYGSSRRGLDHVGHTSVGDPQLGFNAPKEIRSDTIPLPFDDLRLRYVNCPEAPFHGSNDQNVCDGL